MAVYQVRFVHYDDLPYDVVTEIKAESEFQALEIANKRAFATKWWPQKPRLKTWGRKNRACKSKKVKS